VVWQGCLQAATQLLTGCRTCWPVRAQLCCRCFAAVLCMALAALLSDGMLWTLGCCRVPPKMVFFNTFFLVESCLALSNSYLLPRLLSRQMNSSMAFPKCQHNTLLCDRCHYSI
jgi:hypothetical protein